MPKLVRIVRKTPQRKGRKPAQSQNEMAYALLKERIASLAYAPGNTLNIAVLMQELSLGRTPITHALHRLSTEGLVHILPRKGVMVAPLSIDNALELIDVRLANETLCARLAARRAGAAELAALRALAAEFDAAAGQRDIESLMAIDRRFHERIAELSGNQVLVDILRVLHARSQRFWAISLIAEGHLDEVQDEHRAIVEALAAGDPEAAAAAVEQHVLSFRGALLRGR